MYKDLMEPCGNKSNLKPQSILHTLNEKDNMLETPIKTLTLVTLILIIVQHK